LLAVRLLMTAGRESRLAWLGFTDRFVEASGNFEPAPVKEIEDFSALEQKQSGIGELWGLQTPQPSGLRRS